MYAENFMLDRPWTCPLPGQFPQTLPLRTMRPDIFLLTSRPGQLSVTAMGYLLQVDELSQRNRAAGWRQFFGGWWVMAWVRRLRPYSAPNVVGARKPKALIFYTIV